MAKGAKESRSIWWEYEHDSPAPCTFCGKIFSDPTDEADEFRADGSFEPFNYPEGSEEEPALFCETCKQVRRNPPQWWIDETSQRELYDDSSYRDADVDPRDTEMEEHYAAVLREEAQKREKERYLAFDVPLTLGVDTSTGEPVTVTAEELCSGTYVLGTQDAGKSSLLEDIALQRMAHRDSVIVFDPHGKLVDELISRMPEFRLADTYLLDLRDAREHPFSLNIFYCPDPTDDDARERTAERVRRVFGRLWPEIEHGQFVNMTLDYVTSTLIYNQSCTLDDVPRWFTEPLPHEILMRVADPDARYFWTDTLPRYSPHEREVQTQPLLRRLRQLRRNTLLHKLLCSPQPLIDLKQLLQRRQSLLVKLPVDQDVLGYAARHVGVVLFSLLHATTFSDLPDDGSRGYTLAVDEFQNFVSNDFVRLFVGARKYGAKLLLAHQYIDQLSPEGLSANRRGVQTAGTVATFHVTPSDAKEIGLLYSALEKLRARVNLRIDVARALEGHASEAVKTFAKRHVLSLLEESRGQLRRSWAKGEDPYVITGGRKFYFSNSYRPGYETTLYPRRKFGWGDEAFDPANARVVLERLNDLLYDTQKTGRPDSEKRTRFIDALARLAEGIAEDEVHSRTRELDAELRPVISDLIADPLVQQDSSVTRNTASDDLVALPSRTAFVKTRHGVSEMKTSDLPNPVSEQETRVRIHQLLERTRAKYCRSLNRPAARAFDSPQPTARDQKKLQRTEEPAPHFETEPLPPIGRRPPKRLDTTGEQAEEPRPPLGDVRVPRRASQRSTDAALKRLSLRGDMRVCEFAEELSVEDKVVMDELDRLGLFVRSPNSPLSASVVQRLIAAIRQHPES